MGGTLKKNKFLLIFLFIVLIAFSMRVYQLGARPLHHDEGVFEYFFFEPMERDEALVYLGMEYKGLAPFFLTYPFVRLLGSFSVSFRLAAAVFGTLTVALLYFFKDYIGEKGVLFGAAFLAVSPIFVYYSRQWTSYPFLTFFLLVTLLVGIKLLENGKVSNLYWMFVLLAVMLNTNEVFVIFLFTSSIFIYLVYLFDEKFFNEKFKLLKKIKWYHIVIGILIFFFVSVTIHSSFFYEWSNFDKIINLPSELVKKNRIHWP